LWEREDGGKTEREREREGSTVRENVGEDVAREDGRDISRRRGLGDDVWVARSSQTRSSLDLGLRKNEKKAEFYLL
jgi:1,2-phenylacetyl-CoA epoxidase PaaB subunit